MTVILSYFCEKLRRIRFGTNSVLEYKITAMKRLLLTLVFLSFFFTGNTQRFDYDNTSKLFFGVNVGRTWHTSDVQNVKKRFPLGAGFIIGGSINQDYGNAVSFDLRLRYLGGNWYGQDTDTTHAIQNNLAVNAHYDSLGYTVQNFKASQHRLALELAIHANRFKERTGFDPYIFAGIGVTGTRTKGDLLKNTGISSTGTIYPYDQSPNGNIINQDYNEVLDKNDDGDAYEKTRFEANIMPSLGVGIGYYFNSRISLGIEHKSTFFLSDYFDGTTTNQDGAPSNLFKNDIYHYSGIYLKWYFKSHKSDNHRPRKETYIPPTPPTDQIIENTPEEPTRKRPPIVTFNNPGSSPFRTNSPDFIIRANVQYVNSANNLSFTRNGAVHSSFIFNPMTRVFESRVNLDPGENTFYLRGVNPDGSDDDRVVIIYERKAEGEVLPPVVNIVDPAVRPHTVNQLNYIVKADIENVVARNHLTVTFNEAPFTNFSFTPNGNINFNANLTLKAGVNTLKIVGTNNAGMDVDETVIIYTREATDNTGYPPVVEIVTPSQTPYTTTLATEFVEAKIQHITTKSQVDVKINGVSTSNFSYNTATKRVQLNAALLSGTNTIAISARNPYGNDMDQTQIIYRRGNNDVGTPPQVMILSPNTNPFVTESASTYVIAQVENIETKNQVEVWVNGVTTNNFTYNNATKVVQLDLNLNVGSNNVSINATNAYGNDMDNIQINYNRKGNPPTVNILSPAINPFTSSESTANITASVNNVDHKSQIIVKVNGVATSNFNFNPTTKRVELTTGLISGNNSVSIKATNPYGSDEDHVQIIYRRVASDSGSVGTPPKVNITSPSVNPYTTTESTISVMAKVENVNSKSQIEVKVNGSNTNDFTYNNVTKTVQFTASLTSLSNIVYVKASNTYGSDTDETQIIFRKIIEPSGNPPVVSFITPSAGQNTVNTSTFKMIAKVENVRRKSDIQLFFNGSTVDPMNYTFNSTSKNVEYYSKLRSGENTFKVIGENLYGTDQATAKVQMKRPVIEESPNLEETVKPRPCDLPTFTFTSPAIDVITVTEGSFTALGLLQNISSAKEIKAYINGQRNDRFVFNSTTKSFSQKFDLTEGSNTYIIELTNDCGSVQKEFTIHFQAPETCGAKVDLGTIDSDFCLNTSSASYTRANLIANPNFVYKGTAKELYFKAKENGLATVNGSEFPIVKDNYYYFGGNLTVDISRNKPGSVGQWVICVESPRPPKFGKGRARPLSPCLVQTKPVQKKPRVPIIKDKPDTQEVPARREKPARNSGGEIRNPSGGR